jgi:hypothetical protein
VIPMASLSESFRPRAVAFRDAEDVDSGDFGRLSMGAEPLAAQHPHVDTQHHNFYSLLVIAQRNKLDFMPIGWEPGREGLLGIGATARVDQARINIKTSLAFKRFKRWSPPEVRDRNGDKGKVEERAVADGLFLSWIMEIAVLRSPAIAGHPSIIDLEGLAWELHGGGGGSGAESPTVLPVLVYRKADLGTLQSFLESRVNAITLEEKLAICFNISTAVATLHSCGKPPLAGPVAKSAR